MSPIRPLLTATCVAVLLASPARAHDDGRLHVHVNGAAVHADGVPAAVYGVASLAVAASLLLRRRRGTAPRDA